MEILVFVVIVYLFSKLFKSNSQDGEFVQVPPSYKKYKCSCGHNRFYDVKIYGFDRVDENGKEYIILRYTGTCARCGEFFMEDSGMQY